MSHINLLPWREEEIFYKNNIFYAMCTGVALAAVVCILILNAYLKLVMVLNKKNIDYLNSEIRVYKGKTKEITGLKERKEMLLNRLQVINSLQTKRSNTVKVLDKIVTSMPEGVLLNNVLLKGNKLFLGGISESNSRVSLLMRNLEKTKLFSSPVLQEIKAPKGSDDQAGISFTLEVVVLG